ncbi:MAG: carbamoyl-phosphate synthase large subunit [Patescibacteria group bacterium]
MKDKGIKKVLVIGSGPIIIGQAAEFDYSGTQVCLALREDGVKTVLFNSNPATIQTDKTVADKIYFEPMQTDVLEWIIKKEKPDGIIATAGGQTALNLAKKLLCKVRFLGTGLEAIIKGEDRGLFCATMQKIGQPVLASKIVDSVEGGLAFAKQIGYPIVIRSLYTLGGTGSGIAYSGEELQTKLIEGLNLSLEKKALVEKSVVGWGELEYEVIRDSAGNKLMICAMENIDPMGVHTGESIVVAPLQTISDADHQKMRHAALQIVEALDIQGGCNVQFAFDYKTGDYFVIEVNPRLSRSSALASKATGYPIARIAAKIALGYLLPEIINPITGKTAYFEPALDYVVVKIPKWPDEKFPDMDKNIGMTMKSTGETMAIGRTFEEAVYKAIAGLELKKDILYPVALVDKKMIIEKISVPNTERLSWIFKAFASGITAGEVADISGIHPWFIYKLHNL